jgi:hypothetical protein
MGLSLSLFWDIEECGKIRYEIASVRNKNHDKQTFGEVEVYFHSFLTLTLEEGECSV